MVVDIDANSPAKRTVPRSFLGFSIPWGGTNLTSFGNSPAYVTLLSHLTAYDTGRWCFRIGGCAQDNLMDAPDANSLAALANLYRHTGAQFVFGVNLMHSNMSLASLQLRNIAAAVPEEAIVAFEIGNEPDFYKNYNMRDRHWFPDAYIPEFVSFAQQLALDGGPRLRFAGPTLAQLPAGEELGLARFAAAAAPYLSLLTVHAYSGGGKQPWQTAAGLLHENRTAGLAVQLAALVAQAESAGLPLRVDEMGSLGQGGTPGISDGFVSALWTLDVLLEFAAAGAAGINLQGPCGGGEHGFYYYSPIDCKGMQARPAYYALHLFQRATAGGGAMMLPTMHMQLDDEFMLKVWPVLSASGSVRIVFINKSPSSPADITLRLRRAAATGMLTRLTAPTLHERDRITLGGLTWDGSLDGNPNGFAVAEVVHATCCGWPKNVEGGATGGGHAACEGEQGAFEYHVHMPAASAALLVVDPPAPDAPQSSWGCCCSTEDTA